MGTRDRGHTHIDGVGGAHTCEKRNTEEGGDCLYTNGVRGAGFEI